MEQGLGQKARMNNRPKHCGSGQGRKQKSTVYGDATVMRNTFRNQKDNRAGDTWGKGKRLKTRGELRSNKTKQ